MASGMVVWKENESKCNNDSNCILGPFYKQVNEITLTFNNNFKCSRVNDWERGEMGLSEINSVSSCDENEPIMFYFKGPIKWTQQLERKQLLSS